MGGWGLSHFQLHHVFEKKLYPLLSPSPPPPPFFMIISLSLFFLFLKVLMQRVLWENLRPATHILTLQTDTWLCVDHIAAAAALTPPPTTTTTTTRMPAALEASSSSSSSLLSSLSSSSSSLSSSSPPSSPSSVWLDRLLDFATRFDFIGAPDSRNHWNGGKRR